MSVKHRSKVVLACGLWLILLTFVVGGLVLTTLECSGDCGDPVQNFMSRWGWVGLVLIGAAWIALAGFAIVALGRTLIRVVNRRP